MKFIEYIPSCFDGFKTRIFVLPADQILNNPVCEAFKATPGFQEFVRTPYKKAEMVQAKINDKHFVIGFIEGDC